MSERHPQRKQNGTMHTINTTTRHGAAQRRHLNWSMRAARAVAGIAGVAVTIAFTLLAALHSGGASASTNPAPVDAGSNTTQSNGYPAPSQSLFTNQGSGSTISPGTTQSSTTTTRHHTRSSSSR